MYLKHFKCQGVRNLSTCEFDLSSQLNVFFGDNGAGKSSILEAIGLVTSGRSFRTSRLEFVVNEAIDSFSVFAGSDDGHRFGLGYFKKDKKKAIKINGEVVKSLSKLTQYYPTQVLSPESYHLIDSGPGERRKYLDWCLFHVEHMFHPVWKSYSSILKQRNALLRSAKGKLIPEIETQLDIWDKQLCEAAEAISEYRRDVLKQLSLAVESILQSLTVDFSKLISLEYYPGYSNDLKAKLLDNRLLDIKSGNTRAGPHKADLRIKIEGHLAKDYLSRGQKKVLINLLYLAQTLLLKNATGKNSLFIIDDFTSELDNDNQQALLTTLFQQENVQIIVSCLHLDSLNWLKTRYNMAHMFHVKHGTIEQFHNTSSEHS